MLQQQQEESQCEMKQLYTVKINLVKLKKIKKGRGKSEH